LERGDAKRALTYAEEVADRCLPCAVECYQDCLEALGDWEKAEAVAKEMSTGLRSRREHWYFWCVRTGKGDEAAARKLLEESLPADGSPAGRKTLGVLGGYHALNGNPARAAGAFVKASEQDHTAPFEMLAAACYDRAGDATERDRVLKRLN